MKNIAPKTPLVRVGLAAALAMAALAAQANGFTIHASDEHRISVGMSQDEVLKALGRPAVNRHFMNEPGPTWSYEVPDALSHHTQFDVDFSAAGTVLSVSERTIDID